MKLKNKYENYKESKGTVSTQESATDRTNAADVDIYKCIEKYGIDSLMRKSMAQEELFLDCTATSNLTLDEAIRQREQMDEYFTQLPARVRKLFGDNSQIFFERYKNGEFDDFLQTGTLSSEQVSILQKEELNRNQELRKRIIEEEKDNIIRDWQTKTALQKEIEAKNEKI